MKLYYMKEELPEVTGLSLSTIEEEIRHERFPKPRIMASETEMAVDEEYERFMERPFLTERDMPYACGIELPRLRKLIAKRMFPRARRMEGGAVGWSTKEVQQWEQDRLKGIVWRPARTNVHRPTELYRHFDASGRLLYVGIAISTTARLKGHKVNAKWLGQVTTITIERFPSRAEAESAERAAIKAEKPLHNIVHAEKANAESC